MSIIIRKNNFSPSEISSMKFLLQIDWWNDHRSIMPILSDLFALSDTQRYSINNRQATELWCQVIIQYDQTNLILSAIKDNVFPMDPSYSQKAFLLKILEENLKVTSNMLSYLEQKNLVLAGLCMKITLMSKLLHKPEFLFSKHPKLFYSLINNNFLYGHNPKPSIEFLLSNPKKMRNFMIICFSNDLFEITNQTWDGYWKRYQDLDWSLIETAECFVINIELNTVSNDYVSFLRHNFDIFYSEERDSFLI